MNEGMIAMIDALPLGLDKTTAAVGGFVRWLRTHRGAIAMAGLLSFAAPVTFFSGAASVMHDPSVSDLLVLTAWFVLFGMEMSGLLLVMGYLLQNGEVLRRHARSATLLCACTAAAVTELSNGRGYILVEQGVVQSTHTMHAYAIVFALIMALLFFAHLDRSRAREEAAVRLAVAQAAQHLARRRLAQARLQAVQARIDPQLLFEMLDSVRRAYEDDASRAERLLDGLASFLRAALPRLRGTSSSVLREANLARAYAELRKLADMTDIDVKLDVPADVANARFPPGVLLPLLNDALCGRAGSCEIRATRSFGDCRLILTLPARPLDRIVSRVRLLLADLYGASAELAIVQMNGVAHATVKVPYEPG
jgi:hypothetical protein